MFSCVERTKVSNSCKLCALNTKRRALDQIERQLKNRTMNVAETSSLTSESITLCSLSSFPSKDNTRNSKDGDFGGLDEI
ncbi:unnamed protein product [Thelazia callipaeda]|uniref:Uncharacterized protein n=1 Tax=Thelazia callipaeda TaxID=103827 RepID=A0A0N5DBU1_THECL|nr:unnamed protein product [Thelazia callipaeda]